MLQSIKKRYRQVIEGEPGTRFRTFYNLRHEKTQGSPWQNRVYTAVGISLILGGFLLSISPGIPGFILMIAGISMIAARSYFVATFLDAIETSARCVLSRKCPGS